MRRLAMMSLRKVPGLFRLLRDRLMLIPATILTALVPRDPRLWAFGSWNGTRFADNPKHLFLYCHDAVASGRSSPTAHQRGSADSSDAIRAVWLSRDQKIVQEMRSLGLPAFHCHSLRGWYYAARAGVYLFDCRVADVHPYAGRGALHVNMWHGIPLKRIEADIEQADHPVVRARRGPWLVRACYRIWQPQLTERYDHLVATGPASGERLAGAFSLALDRMLVTGYPRTDVILAPTRAERWMTDQERAIVGSLDTHRAAGRRVLLYMPTFRDWNNSTARQFPIDWPAMQALLERDGGVLYLKLHPGDRSRLPDVSAYPLIQLLPSAADVYPLLSRTDALISDYSSIFFDYLLLDRPIVFYAYDLTEYQQRSRTLYDDYASVSPGPRPCTPAALEDAVRDVLVTYDETLQRWQSPRQALRSRFFSFVDAHAALRLRDELVRLSAARRSGP